MKKHNYAFSLSEILMAVVILGILVAITISNAKKIVPDFDKARFKKANLTIEKVVSTLLNDDVLYPDKKGFLNLVQVETEYGETFGVPSEKTKFRDAFKFTVNVIKDKINCPIWAPNLATNNACFQTDDGIVYGIPDTDFLNENTTKVKIQRTNDDVEVAFVPITIYTNYDEAKIKNQTDMKNKAMFLGVRANGRIKVLNNIKCTEESQEAQCKALEFIQAESLRKERK